jgi:hypothetical protein
LIKGSVKDDVYVLGCGAPLGSVIGHVHANRVSAGMTMMMVMVMMMVMWLMVMMVIDDGD